MYILLLGLLTSTPAETKIDILADEIASQCRAISHKECLAIVNKTIDTQYVCSGQYNDTTPACIRFRYNFNSSLCSFGSYVGCMNMTPLISDPEYQISFFAAACRLESDDICSVAAYRLLQINLKKHYTTIQELGKLGCNANVGTSCAVLSVAIMKLHPDSEKDIHQALIYARKGCDTNPGTCFLAGYVALAEASLLYKMQCDLGQELACMMQRKAKRLAQSTESTTIKAITANNPAGITR